MRPTPGLKGRGRIPLDCAGSPWTIERSTCRLPPVQEAHGLDRGSCQRRDLVLVTFTLFIDGGVKANPLTGGLTRRPLVRFIARNTAMLAPNDVLRIHIVDSTCWRTNCFRQGGGFRLPRRKSTNFFTRADGVREGPKRATTLAEGSV
jgi:hypothetical protein